ncbi:hypothetical protein Tco_0403575 [Tanacetum coccineum]
MSAFWYSPFTNSTCMSSLSTHSLMKCLLSNLFNHNACVAAAVAAMKRALLMLLLQLACFCVLRRLVILVVKYLKHPIKLLYSVELTIVPSVIFVNLVPGSIGINVSLQSIIPDSFRILLAYADCFIDVPIG